MTVGRTKLIENYNSLLRQLEKEDINVNMGTIIWFCVFFQSDDVELLKEFDAICTPGIADKYFSENSLKGVFDLIIKRLDLADSPDKERQALYFFTQNAINEGVAFHLGSSANFESIMKLGLGIEAIGLKTEERIDFETLSECGDKKLLTYARSANKTKLFYSTMPILGAWYGKKPEWLMELEKHRVSYASEVDEDSLSLTDAILEKYAIKYKDAHRILFLIPFQDGTISKDDVDQILLDNRDKSDFDLFSLIWNRKLKDDNSCTSNYIPPSSILAVDLLDYSMWRQDEFGNVVKVVNGKSSNNLNK